SVSLLTSRSTRTTRPAASRFARCSWKSAGARLVLTVYSGWDDRSSMAAALWVRKPSVYRPGRWRAIGGHYQPACSGALLKDLRIMTRISIPAARRNGALGAFREAWTLPTNLFGHGAARILRCGKTQRVGGEAT